MNIIQSNFSKNQCRINYNLNNNIKNNRNLDKSLSSNTDFSNASAENYKANYMVNFKGRMDYEKTNSNEIGTLNHQTAFFREPKTDEIVQNYILENFSNEDEINIVSGACSTGEEAKSYAIMLDSLNGKLKIMGFDISPQSIEEAQNHNCQLIKEDDNSTTNLLSLDFEKILLTDNIDDLTEYERRCRDKFKQYYLPKNLPYKVPLFPNAKQQLKDLEALLADKEEFEKQKKQYCEQMQMIKDTSPELAEYMHTSFEDAINESKRVLTQQADAFITVADFETGEHSFDNCSFSLGDVMDLENLYKANSVNILLYRNALYHTLCKYNSMFRYMKDNAQGTMDSIAKQMNKILKKQGLVVFGEEEFMQGIDTKIIKKTMKNNGFKLLDSNNKNNNDNIWVKIKDV